MNIIVSNNMIEYTGFIKVKTLKEAVSITGTIDFLVYHKSNETREEKVECLTSLKDRAHTLIYIRNKDSAENAVQMIVVGSGGKYFDDEFFLENAEELSSLIASLDEVTAIAELGGVSVLSDFFNRYLKDGSSGFNSTYLEVVKEAVTDMITGYKQKDLELLQLSETATEIFSNSASILSKVESERAKLKDMVTSLEKVKKNSSFIQPMSNPTLPNISFFPRVDYLKEKSIIRVKEIGNCSYLTSFMLGFRIYLERIKYVRPKLIFIYPTGELFESIYKNFKWVTQSTYKTMGVYYNNIVFTNFPNKEVLIRLLDDTEYDTFIIVDRLRTGKQHILNSRGSTVKYAVSGNSVIEQFGLKPATCFASRAVKNSLFSLDYVKDYPNAVEQRERLYLRTYEQQYETLYNLSRVR